MRRRAPQIGTWYQDLQTGTMFEVVAVDDTIETQCRDGEVGEYDLESWRQLQLVEAGGPEHWQGVFGLAAEDCRDADDALYPARWGAPLDHIESDIVCGVDEPLA